MNQLDVNYIMELLSKNCIVNGAVMPLNEIESMGFRDFGIRAKLNMPLKLYKYYPNCDTRRRVIWINLINKWKWYFITRMKGMFLLMLILKMKVFGLLKRQCQSYLEFRFRQLANT